MKIDINYDFIEKAIIANRKFKLKEYIQDTLDTTFLSVFILSPLWIIRPINLLISFPAMFVINSILNTIPYIMYSAADKDFIKMRMDNLAKKLCDEGIETTADLLMEARSYKTNYHWDFNSSIIPKLIETSHILVPVNSEENTAKLIVQEHIVGTHNYTLSYKEPEKQKVYSYSANPKRV